MNPLLEKYTHIVNLLPVQIRIFALALAFGIVFSLWNAIFWSPLQGKKVDALEKTRLLTAELLALQQDITKLQKSIPAISATANVVKLTNVSPQKISQTLATLIASRNNLKLLSLKTTQTNTTPPPPSATVDTETKIDPAPAPAPAFEATNPFTENVITIKFRGNYFAVLAYLKNIEQQKWPIYWDNLEYSVTNYPEAEITLQLRALSNIRG